jgi:hypothetical protein
MQTVLDLYETARQRFPAATERADRLHIRQWGGLDPQFAYSWFENLANAVNEDMCREVSYKVHEPLFRFMAGLALRCTGEIHRCIDVAFVENLFWQVPARKCAAYWQPLPSTLKHLYLEFHRRPPVE